MTTLNVQAEIVEAKLTQERLKEALHYCEVTGYFSRLQDVSGVKGNSQQIRATHHSGYIYIMIDGVRHGGHRLAWLYAYGEMPEQIDHINHITGDNRLSNLRVVSPLENSRNISLYKCNTSGVHGVTFLKKQKKWRARIIIKGKEINLGRFLLLEDAIKAKHHAERIYGFHPNHGL